MHDYASMCVRLCEIDIVQRAKAEVIMYTDDQKEGGRVT